MDFFLTYQIPIGIFLLLFLAALVWLTFYFLEYIKNKNVDIEDLFIHIRSNTVPSDGSISNQPKSEMKDISTLEKKEELNTVEDSPIKKSKPTAISLHLGRERALEREFHRKLHTILENESKFLRFILPGVSIKDDKVVFHAPYWKKIPDLESLIAFWADDFRDSRVVLLLAFYIFGKELSLESSKPQKNEKDTNALLEITCEGFLYSAFTIKSLPSKTRQFLQTILIDKNLTEAMKLSSPFGDDNLLIQSFPLFTLGKKNLNRKQIKSKTKWFLNNANDWDYTNFFSELLYKAGNRFVQCELTIKTSIIKSTYSHVALEAFLTSCNPRRIDQILQGKKFSQKINHNMDMQSAITVLRDFFSSTPIPEVYMFMILKRVYPANISTIVKKEPFNRLKTMDMEKVKMLNVNQKLGLYKLFAEQANFTSLMEVFDALPSLWQKSNSIRFYKARAHFHQGKYTKAWDEIHDILQSDPHNLIYLNEAAIYALKTRQSEMSEKIFKTMRELYPNHAQSLYNEAVYFETKAKMEIQERWEKYYTVSKT